MAGARLLESFPQVPLLQNTGLGVALFSYDGKLCWGFNADYGLLPDLEAFRDCIAKSFQELADAAGIHHEGAEIHELRPESGQA